jgi:hypothetical protein
VDTSQQLLQIFLQEFHFISLIMAAATKFSRTSGAAGTNAVPELSNDTLFPTFIDKSAYNSFKSLHKILVNSSPAVPLNDHNKMLEYVIQFIQTQSVDENTRESIVKDNTLLALFTGLYDILHSAIRKKISEKQFNTDLNKLSIPTNYLTSIVSAYSNNKSKLESLAVSTGEVIPSFDRLQWRVDVTISNNKLVRVFKPNLFFQFTTDNGQIQQFECSVERFQELRYEIAKLLKAMQDLAQHPTIQRED